MNTLGLTLGGSSLATLKSASRNLMLSDPEFETSITERYALDPSLFRMFSLNGVNRMPSRLLQGSGCFCMSDLCRVSIGSKACVKARASIHIDVKGAEDIPIRNALRKINTPARNRAGKTEQLSRLHIK